MNQEERWRKEFEELNSQYKLILNSEGNYRDSIVNRLWKNYLAACKKRQEELEKRDRLLDEAKEIIEARIDKINLLHPNSHEKMMASSILDILEKWLKQYEKMRGGE